MSKIEKRGGGYDTISVKVHDLGTFKDVGKKLKKVYVIKKEK